MSEAWETFFRESYLRFSPFILTPDRTRREVEGLLRILALQPGAKVLDLGCGPGRITVPLAQAGYKMAGLDASPVLLARARTLAEQAAVDVRLLQQDMRDLSWEAEFDAIINTGTAFGYFPKEADDAKVLAGVARALKPGGLFLIDTEHRDRQLKALVARTWVPMGEAVVLSHRTFDPLTGRWRETLRWQEAGQNQEAVFDIRLYAATELKALLEAAGLVVESACGGLDGSPLTVDSPRMVLIARKPAQ